MLPSLNKVTLPLLSLPLMVVNRVVGVLVVYHPTDDQLLIEIYRTGVLAVKGKMYDITLFFSFLFFSFLRSSRFLFCFFFKGSFWFGLGLGIGLG